MSAMKNKTTTANAASEEMFAAKGWNEDQMTLAKTLMDGLPPIIARHQVDKFLGGLFAPNTLRNLDSVGKGPVVAWRIGVRVAYKKESLIEWLIENNDVKRMVNLRAL